VYDIKRNVRIIEIKQIRSKLNGIITLERTFCVIISITFSCFLPLAFVRPSATDSESLCRTKKWKENI